jgi:hypothetical protein
MIKLKCAHNGGSVVQIHMIGNLRFLAHPSSYLRFEYNYGVVATSGFNLIVLISYCASCARVGCFQRRRRCPASSSPQPRRRVRVSRKRRFPA